LADITDLVFIDPIGTGFSRSLPQDKDIQDKSGEKANPSQVDGNRIGSRAGLESVGEFIQRFLSPKAMAVTHFHCWRAMAAFGR